MFDRENLERWRADPGGGPPARPRLPADRARERRGHPQRHAGRAIASIGNADQLPLTIDEGMELGTHDLEGIEEDAGFSLLASGCGDGRVMARWIGDNRPKLGWRWAVQPAHLARLGVGGGRARRGCGA